MSEQQLPNVDITLSLKLAEIDYIFKVVTAEPYRDCGAIIDKMRAQVIPQLPAPLQDTLKPEPSTDTPPE